MKDSALSIANYFVDKAQQDKVELRPLKLLKLVYIAHGFMLALLDYSVLNSRFDVVEAWRLGPVVPSVYHSFKHFKDQPITSKSEVFVMDDDGHVAFETPMLENQDARTVCDFVWNRYKGYSDSGLVTLLHKEGTPWEMFYKKDRNMVIPDEYTRVYYRGLVEYLKHMSRNGQE